MKQIWQDNSNVWGIWTLILSQRLDEYVECLFEADELQDERVWHLDQKWLSRIWWSYDRSEQSWQGNIEWEESFGSP